jgi:hypothetical protein
MNLVRTWIMLVVEQKGNERNGEGRSLEVKNSDFRSRASLGR